MALPVLLVTALVSGLCLCVILSRLVWRVPLMMLGCGCRDLHLLTPGTHCPHCRQLLPVWHQCPLVGQRVFGSQCKGCYRQLGNQPWWVDGGVVLLTTFVVWRVPLLLPALQILAFCTLLLALAIIDLRHHSLPDLLTLPLLWGGLLAALLPDHDLPLADAVLGAALGWLAPWSLYWLMLWSTHKAGIGYGDFKLIAALGAWFGYAGLPTIILWAALVTLAALWLRRIVQHRPLTAPIAFGPGLAISALYHGLYPLVP